MLHSTTASQESKSEYNFKGGKSKSGKNAINEEVR